jgi:hypothetical protein
METKGDRQAVGALMGLLLGLALAASGYPVAILLLTVPAVSHLAGRMSAGA